MSKHYSYKTFLKKKKTKRKFFVSLLGILILLLLGVFLIKNGKLYHYVVENFKIKKILIECNNSTIPNDVLYQECNNYLNNNIFRLRYCIKKLKNKFPEIEQVKIKWFPIGCVKVKVISVAPIWYFHSDDEGIRFLSPNFRWFKVYDIKKINLDDLTEYRCDNYTQKGLQLAQQVYMKFKNVQPNIKITKIYVKHNMECVVTVANNETEQQIIVDENVSNIANELLNKIINISLQQKVGMYTRLLLQGRIYILNN